MLQVSLLLMRTSIMHMCSLLITFFAVRSCVSCCPAHVSWWFVNSCDSQVHWPLQCGKHSCSADLHAAYVCFPMTIETTASDEARCLICQRLSAVHGYHVVTWQIVVVGVGIWPCCIATGRVKVRFCGAVCAALAAIL